MDQNAPTTDETQALVSKIQDIASSYDHNADPIALVCQRAALRNAASDLYNAMSEPMDVAWKKLFNMTEAVSLRTAASMGVFQAIPLDGAISKTELAKKVQATEALIERMLRILVTSSMLDQTDDLKYKHNRISRSFVDLMQPGTGNFVVTLYDVFMKSAVRFDEYVHETKRDGLFAEPDSVFNNPFVNCWGKGGQSVWDVMAAKQQMMQQFQMLLTGMDRLVTPVGPFYDFSQFKATGPDDDRTQIVDVGGGIGSVTLRITAAHSEIDPTKCVLQDVENVLAVAHDIRKLGVKTQPIDFHKEQPVKGARCYFMRFITHDYPDKEIINILRHISNAMTHDSKLVMADTVMPDRIDESSIQAGVLDQIMFCIGGVERTESGFHHILKEAGLELTGVNPIPGTSAAVIEAMRLAN